MDSKNSKPLDRTFFTQPTLLVARHLLGKRLVRLCEGKRISGIIAETEAYIGQDDLSCHARFGKTERNKVMFGKAGCAYVYFTYGMHWLLNIVTEAEGFPAAVLIRSIYPQEGLDIIAKYRKKVQPAQWTNGPAKLCQALAIDGSFNSLDLCTHPTPLFIEEGIDILPSNIKTSARIGINNVPQPWRDMPWRFYVSTIN